MSAVRPYPNTARWTFQSRRSGHERTVRLALQWEPDGSAMSDDYLPEDEDAAQLWRMWVNKYGNQYHQDDPAVYAPWHVPIYWAITSVGPGGGTFEHAPHQTLPSRYLLKEHFLTHYTHPRHEGTGELVNWLRLPVLDRGWNAEQADKGGFIQEATGWKPSPLQPFMDVRQVAQASAAYLPQ